MASPYEGKHPELRLTLGNDVYYCRDRETLGRDGSLAREFFNQYRSVSRQHLSLQRTENGWALMTAANVTNATFLDSVELTRDVFVPLHGRHKLVLADACKLVVEVISGD